MCKKTEMRKEIKLKLSELGSVSRNKYSELIRNKLVKLKEFQQAKKVFIYISFDNEVHTPDIIKDALDMDKRVFVPNIEDDNMYMIEINKESAYTVNDYGIVEPLSQEEYDGEIDLVIMPLIGFDRNLSRLGRGGGFYDKFLTDRQCTKIAIAYSCQEADSIPVESHDVRMDMVVTDKDIIV